jgi:hypothetical protein
MKSIYKPGDIIIFFNWNQLPYSLKINNKTELTFWNSGNNQIYNISQDNCYTIVTDIFREPSLNDKLFRKIS